MNLPVPVALHPLLVNVANPTGGQHVQLAAADLPTARHTVQLILDGPGGRWTHNLVTSNGIAAGIVVLPAPLATGQWTLAVVDLSAAHFPASGKPSGTANIGLDSFTVR